MKKVITFTLTLGIIFVFYKVDSISQEGRAIAGQLSQFIDLESSQSLSEAKAKQVISLRSELEFLHGNSRNYSLAMLSLLLILTTYLGIIFTKTKKKNNTE